MPLWIVTMLTALLLAIVDSGMVGYALRLLLGPARKRSVKILSLFAFSVALWAWPDSSKSLQASEMACLGYFGDFTRKAGW